MDYGLTPRQLRRWFGRIAVTILIVCLATQLLAVIATLVWQELTGSYSYAQLIILNDLCVYPPSIVIFALLLRRLPKLDPLPVHPLDGQEGFLAVAFSLGAGYLSAYVGVALIRLLEEAVGLSASNRVSDLEAALPPLLAVLAFVVVAPLAEEFLFRRLLLERTRFLGDGSAILLNGAAFALFHGNLNQTLYAFTLGMVFAAIVLMTGRLRYTIGIHALINGISTASTFLPQEWFKVLVSLCILFSMIFAVVLFLVRRKRYTLESGPLPFSEREKLRACFASPWTWIVLVGGLAFSTINVFL